MALSTTDLGKEGGSGLPKTISPGNNTVKVNSVHLDEFKFIPGAYHLMLNVETKPIEGFKGFMIDKDDESKGHYAGQIGRVKAAQYAFADGKTKSGVPIFRDKSILVFMQNFCKATGCMDWFQAKDYKYNTIEELVEAFNNDAPFANKYLDVCIAGKEYEGKSGYTNYDLWFPKGVKDLYSYGPEGGKVLPYNELDHLKKLEVKPVEAFDTDDFSVPARTSSDFNLD
jgi:hypothetical protein